MNTEAAGAGHYELDGSAPVPKIQIVTVEEALQLRDRAVRLPARRDDAFKRAGREQDRSAQGSLDTVPASTRTLDSRGAALSPAGAPVAWAPAPSSGPVGPRAEPESCTFLYKPVCEIVQKRTKSADSAAPPAQP